MEIPAPTPIDVEQVLVGMMDGTSAFAHWLKLDEADLGDSGKEMPGNARCGGAI